MDKQQTREFYDQLRTEYDQVSEEREALAQRETALSQMIDGMRSLYPWIVDEDERQEESNVGVAQHLTQILNGTPETEWLSVRDLTDRLPIRGQLLDAESAVRAAIRRLDNRLEKRPRDGRTQEYRWNPVLRH